jgi:hypothetical protein
MLKRNGGWKVGREKHKRWKSRNSPFDSGFAISLATLKLLTQVKSSLKRRKRKEKTKRYTIKGEKRIKNLCPELHVRNQLRQFFLSS